MKVLFLGDSHNFRLETAFRSVFGNRHALQAAFLTAPGPIAEDVSIRDGRLHLNPDKSRLADLPGSDKFDFGSWHTMVEKRLAFISETHSLDCAYYDVIVVVGFQLHAQEVWAEPALAWARGEISHSVFRAFCADTFRKGIATPRSRHVILLDQLHGMAAPVLSVPTPLGSEVRPFPDSLLQPQETLGHRAFAASESETAMLMQDAYGSVMVRYPEALLSRTGLSTDVRFQAKSDDMHHLSEEGCRIQLQAVLQTLDTMVDEDVPMIPA